ncbi:MAG TPA: alpha/beta hydrolase [Thermoleophilaceae bacterium]|nr:alpha/beta hydrolase [Thermoleophilaceae bacterium]
MKFVNSLDGSKIAYDQTGTGDPVILVDGALCSRQLGPFPETAQGLAEHYTVVHYDRRGRGDSSDESAGRFEIERELEDLQALIEQVGGRASLVGMSSGGALAIEAANRLPSVRQVVVYEVPFITDPEATFPPDYSPKLRKLVAAGRRSEAVRLFLRTVGMPAPLVQLMRITPPFRKLKRVAHTLPYDAALVADPLGAERELPTRRWTSIQAPVTVIAGGKSPDSMRQANADLAELLGAEYRTLDGQNHMIKGRALAPVLAQVLKAGRTAGPTAGTRGATA